ncbi:4-hydroxybenzoate transporter PcaK [Halioglobus japonicus]|nr:4-hydroxybenzoate transporter PcaK [Halioglobus japonicus]
MMNLSDSQSLWARLDRIPVWPCPYSVLAIASSLIGHILGPFLDSRLADHFGRKAALLISVALFSLGSLLSAASPSLDWLVFWCFVAGIGIGAEIVLVTFIEPTCRPRRYVGGAPGGIAFTLWRDAPVEGASESHCPVCTEILRRSDRCLSTRY